MGFDWDYPDENEEKVNQLEREASRLRVERDEARRVAKQFCGLVDIMHHKDLQKMAWLKEAE